MRPFKFLSTKKQVEVRSIYGSTNMSCTTFVDGTHITRLTEQLTANCNRLQHESVIMNFRWVNNFNHRIILGENYRTNSEVYEGTVGRFYETYEHRRYGNRYAMVPPVPVIESIECNGNFYYTDTLKFSNNDMWVKITYKKFYERL